MPPLAGELGRAAGRKVWHLHTSKIRTRSGIQHMVLTCLSLPRDGPRASDYEGWAAGGAMGDAARRAARRGCNRIPAKRLQLPSGSSTPASPATLRHWTLGCLSIPALESQIESRGLPCRLSFELVILGLSVQAQVGM